MNAQEYYINIRPGNGFAETIKISQYDVGRPLSFHLMDGAGPLAIPSGSTVTIRGTKPSGLGFTEDCTISGSTVSVSTTLGMSQEFGFFPVELVVAYNDDVIATGNAMLLVEMSPHQDGTTDGTKEELDDLYTEVANLKEDIENISGISDDVKVALLDCFAHVAWTDEHGQDYYDALEEALYAEEPKTLVSISAVYTQSGTVYDTDTLDSLKADLVVTATYDDSTTETVTAYTLSGTLEEGTSTITVSYGGKTTTFDVTVTMNRATRFGTFTGGYSLGKRTSSSGSYGNTPQYGCWNNTATARAALTVPIVNLGYVFTVTDSTKYNIRADGLIDQTAYPTTYADAVTGVYYRGDTSTPEWGTTSATSQPYLLIALKKLDGTDFTDEELANGAEAVFTFTKSERAEKFGQFTNGYGTIKQTSGASTYAQDLPFAFRTTAAARATTKIPCANKGYIVTVTDSTKYNINVKDVNTGDSFAIPTLSESVDKIAYQCGNASTDWAESASVSTPYAWIALKKMDGTAFTDAELADGAAAVFNYTEV